MSKDRPVVGIDGVALPILPPERDARVWARLVRVMFYLPGFMALLLIKSGEPSSFGITVELLMLSSGAAIIGGLFIGAQSSGAGADPSSKVGTWSGSLVLELLAVVPFLCAVPPLFHELAHSRLLHTLAPGAVDVSLGASEILPAVAIVPFMVYELAGFGTLHFIVSKPMNWIINMGVLCLIIGGYISNLKDAFDFERKFDGALVAAMTITVFYGVLKLKRLQTAYDADRPPKAPKE
ncbi:hypothetical protein [Tunturiibacter lichenicola]|jgi:hypothetical protein|uniref:hypothetical protein n=1 Tax=Tunturiibacter lichenicola TaxID=2051959 RepID=UPI003D9B067B